MIDGLKKIKKVLHLKSLLYLPEIIRNEIISQHHDNQLASYFRIDKNQKLIAQKYYCLSY